MYLAVSPVVDPTATGGPAHWRLRPVAPDGAAAGPERRVDAAGLAGAELERPRWLMDAAARVYPDLLAAGCPVRRSHDVTLTERILLARDGRSGEPSSAAAVHARARGLTVPTDPDPAARDGQPGLFESGDAGPEQVDPLEALATAIADQHRRIGSDNALRLLVAAESASGLAAAEMGFAGLPWDVREHDRLLTAALGPRPVGGARPVKLAALAGQISAAFGFEVNPDSVTDVRNAFRRSGFDIESTGRWVLRELAHPAAGLVLQYKELSRLYTANGWNWIADWVRDGRLHSEFVPGGVVSGRWATRGGGGLQIPRAIRAAARAEPGYRLVVADAAQLEPRVLAALSADPALQAVSTDADLYAGLAADGFGGDRAAAKLAMLGAMYGQTSGEAGRLLGTLRSRYPAAVACVEAAARQGEAGGVVRSVLGRTSPPPGGTWRAVVATGTDETASDADRRRAREYARSWGRFTRNFVVQASAADWAAVWLSTLRRELASLSGAELVFFQHDEVVVHAPQQHAAAVAEIAIEAAEQARDLVFPGATASTPVRPMIVGGYAEAK